MYEGMPLDAAQTIPQIEAEIREESCLRTLASLAGSGYFSKKLI
jgi:hypothetical protein